MLRVEDRVASLFRLTAFTLSYPSTFQGWIFMSRGDGFLARTEVDLYGRPPDVIESSILDALAEYVAAAQATIDRQLQLAGARLARVLNALFR